MDGPPLTPFPLRPGDRTLIGGAHETAATKEECEREGKVKKISSEQKDNKRS